MIRPFGSYEPVVHADAFVHELAVLIGEVFVEEGASIWPHAVLRGDLGPICIGRNSSIQDGTICHDTRDWAGIEGLHPGNPQSVTRVGERVTVGHRVILHGCTIGDDVLVGMGSIILDNVIVGDGSLIGAGAVLTPGTVIPPGSLVLGFPGKVIRPLTEKERIGNRHANESYQALCKSYREQG